VTVDSGKPRIVVVGAGISGAACAAALAEAGLSCEVVERGRAPGGRLASPEIEGRRVDLGASYFTVTDPAFDSLVRRWLIDGAVRPWTDTVDVFDSSGRREPSTGPMRWSAPGGLRSLVRLLLAERSVRTEHAVDRLDHDGSRLRVDDAPVDVAVLAMPDPQALRLLGDSHAPADAPADPPKVTGPCGGADAIPAARAAAADIDYHPVIAVTAGWRTRNWPIADAAFVNDHPVLAFVADDGARRGDGAAVLVGHSTPAFAARHLDRPREATARLVSAMREVLGIAGDPSWASSHPWRFAKPSGTHGDRAFFLDGGVGLAGDSWCPQGAPRVESAWLSGTRLGHAIARQWASEPELSPVR